MKFLYYVFLVEASQGVLHSFKDNAMSWYNMMHDVYDRENVNDSVTFLWNSIDSNLKKLIAFFLNDTRREKVRVKTLKCENI